MAGSLLVIERLAGVAVLPLWLTSASGFAFWVAVHAATGGLRK